jgi:hypothetical protein
MGECQTVEEVVDGVCSYNHGWDFSPMIAGIGQQLYFWNCS